MPQAHIMYGEFGVCKMYQETIGNDTAKSKLFGYVPEDVWMVYVYLKKINTNCLDSKPEPRFYQALITDCCLYAYG